MDLSVIIPAIVTIVSSIWSVKHLTRRVSRLEFKIDRLTETAIKRRELESVVKRVIYLEDNRANNK